MAQLAGIRTDEAGGAPVRPVAPLSSTSTPGAENTAVRNDPLLFKREAVFNRWTNPRLAAEEWRAELCSIKFWQACLGEFIGMMFFLFAVSTCVVFTYPYADPSGTSISSVATYVPRIVLIAATFGLTITVLVFALAHISGGHLNPAVSLVLWLRGNISALRFLAYVAFQMAGACAGAAWCKSLNPTLYNAAGGAANFVNRPLFAGMDVWTALGAEWMATAILCWAVLASCDIGRDKITRRSAAMNPLAIGLAVFLCHLALIPIDGTSINPARSFGASAVYGVWTDQWIFWVGPFLGSIWALLTYELVYFLRPSIGEAAITAEASTVPTTAPSRVPTHAAQGEKAAALLLAEKGYTTEQGARQGDAMSLAMRDKGYSPTGSGRQEMVLGQARPGTPLAPVTLPVQSAGQSSGERNGM